MTAHARIGIPSRRRLLAGVAITAIVAACGTGSPPRGTPAPSTPATTNQAGPTVLTTADLDHAIPAGTYRIGDPFEVPFQIRFADGWTPLRLSAGEAVLASETASPELWLTVHLVEDVFADPCRSAAGPITPAPRTAAAIVEAVDHFVRFEVTATRGVTIDGRPATALELRNTINTETAGCDGGPMLPLWTFRGGSDSAATNGGTRQLLWVVDVDDVPVVIVGETVPTLSEPGALALAEIVRAMTFPSTAS